MILIIISCIVLILIILLISVVSLNIKHNKEDYVINPYLTPNEKVEDWTLPFLHNRVLYLHNLNIRKFDNYIQILTNNQEYILPFEEIELIGSNRFVLILSTNLGKIVVFRSGKIASEYNYNNKKGVKRVNHWYVLSQS